jgi:murein DD-endopeptidase MepM/ murein hydrolase activator NlpD
MPRRRAGRLFVIGLGLVSLSHWGGSPPLDRPLDLSALVEPTAPLEPRPLFIGPPAPSDEERARDFFAELGGDRWLHPLPGPVRRMPIRDSRVFGAARDGHRPGECRSGHCGVDIGGEIWGEPVYAVHDGVVDRVVRDPKGRGGLYVRLSHRDGTVFTQYFHLAAIPRDLRERQKVRAGQVVGLVGDTGVRSSTAHLHFTISVRPSADSDEIFMDPEPLIALWPLKTPRDDGGANAVWNPGVPRGAAGRPRRASRHGDRSVAPAAAKQSPAPVEGGEARRTTVSPSMGPVELPAMPSDGGTHASE